MEKALLAFLAGLTLGMLICVSVVVRRIATARRPEKPSYQAIGEETPRSATTAVRNAYRTFRQISEVLERLDRQEERVAAIEAAHNQMLIRQLNKPRDTEPSLHDETVARPMRSQRWATQLS